MAKEETLEDKVIRLESEKLALEATKSKFITQVTDLTSEKQTLVESLKTITVEKNKALTDLAELQEKHNALDIAHTALAEESVTEIARLSAELNEAKSDASDDLLSVTIDGIKHRVIGKKFNIEGRGELSVKDIIKDKNLLKDLVKQGVGFLIPA